MIKKITGVAISILLILVIVLPVVSSINTNTSIKLVTKITYDNKCNKCDESHTPLNGDVFPQCVVMNNQFLDFELNNPSPRPIIIDTPDEFSWKNYNGQDWTTIVKNQGNCGSCWDFAAIGVFESIINIREDSTTLDPDLSEQYVLSCLPDAGSCRGGSTYHALLYMMETSPEGNYHNGTIPESCFLYQANDKIPCDDKCPDWEDMLIPILDCGYWDTHGTPEDIEAIKTQVMQYGPVSVGIMATAEFSEWGSTHHSPDDYYPYPGPVDWTNHAVVLVGWKDDPSIGNGGYWIIKNSWSEFWGYDGFFNIEYGSLNVDNSGVVWVDYDPESIYWSPIADAGGIYNGDIGEEIHFDASKSFTEDNIASYSWDFGDDTTGNGISPIHVYTQKGIYPIILTVTDNEDKIAIDTTWVAVAESFDPPDKPTISGPTNGKSGTNYEYTFKAIDPNGDNVYYFIDWDDGTFEEWFGFYASGETVNVSHIWITQGNYNIRTKAKDIYDAESDWSDPLSVSMPKNKPYFNTPFLNFLQNFLQNHPLIYQLLQQFLNL